MNYLALFIIFALAKLVAYGVIIKAYFQTRSPRRKRQVVLSVTIGLMTDVFCFSVLYVYTH